MNQIYCGDIRDIAKTLPDQSVNCIVTSPPYFGLRDYGVDKQIGLEETPKAYVDTLVGIFRELKRVLRDDGTAWLNLGDSYATSCTGSVATDKQLSNKGSLVGLTFDKSNMNLSAKNLVGIPWRVAFALQADGWYLRSDIIWHKKNPMPESVTDRPTKAHEYIFLLSKQAKYYYDNEAVREDSPPYAKERISREKAKNMTGNVNRPLADQIGLSESSIFRKQVGARQPGRNRRSVWTVSTKPYKAAHFAVFPPDLIRPCILAGCPPGGVVLDPFMGSGTVAQVAIETGRNWLGVELNPEYIELANKRIAQTQPALPIEITL